MEIGIFTFTIAVYLLIIFKTCDGDRWNGRHKEKKQESDWLDRLFGKIKRLSICNRVSFTGMVVIMAICIVVEACLLIRVNFTRLEGKHLSYRVQTQEIRDKY